MASLPPGRLFPYELGCGDFCFLSGWYQGRKLEALKRKAAAEAKENLFTNKQMLLCSSAGIDLTGPAETPFIPSTPFPLMALPKEIRNQIYRYAISPFIGPIDDDDMHEVEAFDGIILQVEGPTYIPHWPSGYPGIPQDRAETAEERKRRLKFRPLKHTVAEKHPGREYNDYDVYPAMMLVNYPLLREVEDVLNLSNTNSIVRKELADIFWARTRIVVDPGECYNFVQLEHFLLDRPLIWSGIKELKFGYQFQDHGPPPREFMKFCQRFTQMIQLDKLHLHITMDENQVDEFFKTPEKPLWAMAIRSLNVSKEFKLDLTAYPEDYEDWDDGIEDLRERYEDRMEDELCPQSLLPKEKALHEMNEVEKYMATRLQDN